MIDCPPPQRTRTKHPRTPTNQQTNHPLTSNKSPITTPPPSVLAAPEPPWALQRSQPQPASPDPDPSLLSAAPASAPMPLESPVSAPLLLESLPCHSMHHPGSQAASLSTPIRIPPLTLTSTSAPLPHTQPPLPALPAPRDPTAAAAVAARPAVAAAVAAQPVLTAAVAAQPAVAAAAAAAVAAGCPVTPSPLKPASRPAPAPAPARAPARTTRVSTPAPNPAPSPAPAPAASSAPKSLAHTLPPEAVKLLKPSHKKGMGLRAQAERLGFLPPLPPPQAPSTPAPPLTRGGGSPPPRTSADAPAATAAAAAPGSAPGVAGGAATAVAVLTRSSARVGSSGSSVRSPSPAAGLGKGAGRSSPSPNPAPVPASAPPLSLRSRTISPPPRLPSPRGGAATAGATAAATAASTAASTAAATAAATATATAAATKGTKRTVDAVSGGDGAGVVVVAAVADGEGSLASKRARRSLPPPGIQYVAPEAPTHHIPSVHIKGPAAKHECAVEVAVKGEGSGATATAPATAPAATAQAVGDPLDREGVEQQGGWVASPCPQAGACAGPDVQLRDRGASETSGGAGGPSGQFDRVPASAVIAPGACAEPGSAAGVLACEQEEGRATCGREGVSLPRPVGDPSSTSILLPASGASAVAVPGAAGGGGGGGAGGGGRATRRSVLERRPLAGRSPAGITPPPSLVRGGPGGLVLDFMAAFLPAEVTAADGHAASERPAAAVAGGRVAGSSGGGCFSDVCEWDAPKPPPVAAAAAASNPAAGSATAAGAVAAGTARGEGASKALAYGRGSRQEAMREREKEKAARSSTSCLGKRPLSEPPPLVHRSSSGRVVKWREEVGGIPGMRHLLLPGGGGGAGRQQQRDGGAGCSGPGRSAASGLVKRSGSGKAGPGSKSRPPSHGSLNALSQPNAHLQQQPWRPYSWSAGQQQQQQQQLYASAQGGAFPDLERPASPHLHTLPLNWPPMEVHGSGSRLGLTPHPHSPSAAHHSLGPYALHPGGDPSGLRHTSGMPDSTLCRPPPALQFSSYALYGADVYEDGGSDDPLVIDLESEPGRGMLLHDVLGDHAAQAGGGGLSRLGQAGGQHFGPCGPHAEEREGSPSLSGAEGSAVQLMWDDTGACVCGGGGG